MIPQRLYLYCTVPLCNTVTLKSRFQRTYGRILKSVLKLLGYLGNAIFHAIRRYPSKKVDSERSREMYRS